MLWNDLESLLLLYSIESLKVAYKILSIAKRYQLSIIIRVKTTFTKQLHKVFQFEDIGKMTKVDKQQYTPWIINWPILAFLTYVHIAGLVGVFYIPFVKWQTLLMASQTTFWAALGVTGGLHRLWSHRSYKAHWTLRTFLMFCSSLANQGTIYHWTRDHRVHHKNSETEADPHNVRI